MNINFNDFVFFIGMIISGAGLWLWSPALSLTVIGIILMLASWFWEGGN